MDSSDFRSDVDAATRSDVDLVEAACLEFLPGYEPSISENFREWVDSTRSQIHQKITSRLVPQLESARRRGDWARADMIAELCLSLDRYNETAVLARAEAVAMRGGKLKAVSMLDDFLTELGSQTDLKLPAKVLRKRVIDRIPERPALRSSDARFVGREREMELLTRRFDAVRSNRGCAVQLLGEPGIGKSRLCQEFAQFVELQGAYVHRARCRRTHLERPISLFVELVPFLRELPGALGCDPKTFVTLRRLTEFDKSLGGISTADQSEPLFENIKEALFDLFDSLVEEKPLVLIVDDAQWLDTASQKILLTLVEWAETKRLFLVLNARGSNDLVTAFFETVHVGPLTAAASKALLESISIPEDVPSRDDFIPWCLNIAEGNPFFLQELLHHWVENGQTFEAPPSITKILDDRVARLGRDSRQVLQAASVLGDHASIERIQKVLDIPSHRLLTAVEELSAAVMLKANNQDPGNGCDYLQPRHDLLCSAVLKPLATPALAFFHRRAADVIESEFAGVSMPIGLLWACATHRDAAGDHNKALAVSLACAEHLLDVGLVADSVGAFQKSLEYCASDDTRLRVLPRLAHAAQVNGDWNKATDALRACIRLASKIEPESGHSDFELTLFGVRHQSDLNFAALLQDLMPCVTCNTASPDHRVRAAILALKIATDFGPPDTLDTIFESVQSLLDDQRVESAWGLELLIIYRTTRRHEAVPIGELQALADNARRVGGEAAYASALWTASSACRITGRYNDAHEFLNRAYALAREKKRWSLLYRLHVVEIRLHFSEENYDAAAETLQRATTYSVPPDDFTRTDLLAYAVRLALQRGELVNAKKLFDDLGPISNEHSPRRRAHSFALLVRIKLMDFVDGEELRSLVNQLSVESGRVRALGGHDFEAYSLYLGLTAIGEDGAAKKMLTEYVLNERQAGCPLPTCMRDALVVANTHSTSSEMSCALLENCGVSPRRGEISVAESVAIGTV
jgi:hypothetical protein